MPDRWGWQSHRLPLPKRINAHGKILTYAARCHFSSNVDSERGRPRFLQLYLPAQFLSICDLSTLQLASGSFIEEDLRSSYSDILYSLQTRHGAGYIYALIEHQSSPDKFMAFRLMRYTLVAIQRHLDAGHDTLPLVVPILFYHGAVSPWPHTLNWHHLFNHPELASALYGGDFPLMDLTVMPDNQFILHQRMAMLELLQKHIRQRDLAELQPILVALLAIAEWLEEKGRKKGEEKADWRVDRKAVKKSRTALR